MESVRAFACPVCHGFVPFESRRCPNCSAELGLYVPSRTMVATSSGAAVIDGQIWIACTKAASLGCNWLVPQEQELGGQRGRCLADSLIRREPDTDDTVAVEKLVSTGIALRRLICQLIDIGLPVDPFWRKDGGLAFDLLSSYSGGERVVIGHAGGVITIDLVESLDAYRESLRVHLGEPYRTMLGHFRHEVGHYYQNILVETDPGAARYLDECREMLGGLEVGERCVGAQEFSSQAAVEPLNLAGRGRAARRSQQMLDAGDLRQRQRHRAVPHEATDLTRSANCVVRQQMRGLRATRELATHHRPRLPGLLIATISRTRCYKPTSHFHQEHQAPGTGPDTQQ
jgi:hypothetical protein